MKKMEVTNTKQIVNKSIYILGNSMVVYCTIQSFLESLSEKDMGDNKKFWAVVKSL